MIILKTIVFIWTVCSICISGIWFILYADNRAKDLGKIDLLATHLVAPYLTVYIFVITIKDVIKSIIKIIKKRGKKNEKN